MNTVKFENIYGEEISENQAGTEPIYSKVTLADGEPKTIEQVNNNEVIHYDYFLSDEESVSGLLPQYSDKNVSFYKTQLSGNYKIQEVHFYENAVLSDRSRYIIEAANNQGICFQKLDLLTGAPVLGSTEKYYYQDGDVKYLFDYDDSGNCFMISDQQEFGGDILASAIGKPGTTFEWAGFEYYRNAMPVVPA